MDGLSPADKKFLNHEAWNLGEDLLAFGLSGATCELEFAAMPARNRYATLLAETISALACFNCSSIGY